MARPQYPSDHRRYFRVMEDILDNDKLNAVSLADQMLYLRLLAVLNRQKSKDGDGYLPTRSATALADRERWAYAKPAYDRLVAGGLVALTHLDDGVEYRVCNWAKLQGFTPAELRRDSVVTPSPIPTPVPTPTPKKRRPVATAPVGGSAPGNGKAKREPSEEARWVFSFLSHAIQRSMPGASVPAAGTERCRRWCVELERLHTLGEPGGSAGFAWQDIRAVIEWLPTHERGDFRWGLVIRSASKFRSHFARLLAECKQGIGETDDQRYARMARELEEEKDADRHSLDR